MTATLERPQDATRHILHAVIGVWFRGEHTFYVKRSKKMKNYPGAWSLFSIQYTPGELPDSLDLDHVQRLMDRMSNERLRGSPISVRQFLTASTCTKNPINMIVNLRLYHVEFANKPALNRAYYEDAAWMTPPEYAARRGNALCGSCLRMWREYSSKHIQTSPATINDTRVIRRPTGEYAIDHADKMPERVDG